jgi:shikimate kinase
MNKIALIGMPSAGKTTVGSHVAQKLGFDFLDLDSMVEEKEGKSLIDVMDEKGPDYFRAMEFDFIKDIDKNKKVVISPAGSIIFYKDAIDWIADNCFVVFLDTPFEVIQERLSREPKAVAGLKERGLKSIWDERRSIYEKYAQAIVKTDGRSLDQISEEIISQFAQR